MTWSTLSTIRMYTGLTVTDIDDTNLEIMISEAERQVRNDLFVRVVEEDITSTTDGTEAYTEHYPIADGDFSKAVDKNDVVLYGWGDADDESTKSSVTVSSVTASTGRIIASSSLDGYDKVTIDYWYSLSTIDYTALDWVVSLMVAFMYVRREYFFIPDYYKIGPLTIRGGEHINTLLKDYRETIDRLRIDMWKSVKFDTPILSREKLLYNQVTNPEKDQ